MKTKSNKKSIRIFLCVLLGLFVSANAVRIKDVAQLEGLSDTQLVGYGIVVGLNGSGDGTRTQFTTQSVINMLRNMGIEVPSDNIRLRNVAAVMVTANLHPFVKKGGRIDVSISSLGDAKSLEGGTLLMTPLQGPDRQVRVVAQGAVSTGGLSAMTAGASSARKNQVLSGLIPGGGIVQVERKFESLDSDHEIRWALRSPDFSSAVAMAKALDSIFPGMAKAEDAGSVVLKIPENRQNDLMNFVSISENVEFTPSTIARVILNEKTGTVVAGTGVKIDEVAVSHGSVTIKVQNNNQVSQPNSFSQGTTVASSSTNVTMQEQPSQMKVIPQASSVGDLSQALNSLGVSPRDIIAIFQAIKKAGALHAELIIM